MGASSMTGREVWPFARPVPNLNETISTLATAVAPPLLIPLSLG